MLQESDIQPIQKMGVSKEFLFAYGDLIFDATKAEKRIFKVGQKDRLKMEPKAVSLLWRMAQVASNNLGQILSRDSLELDIETGRALGENAVPVYLGRVRETLKKAESIVSIENVHGVGWRLQVDVTNCVPSSKPE